MATDDDILAQVNQLVAEEKQLRDAGGDPREAEARPASLVENYLN